MINNSALYIVKYSNIKKTYLSIPCHWNKQVFTEVMEQNLESADVKIAAVYGALAQGPIAHGRMPNSVPNVTKKDALDFKNM